MSETPNTCGQCIHWWRHPRPPGPIDLSAPVNGDCRHDPVKMHFGPNGQVFVGYPGVPATFPACNQFREREEWQE